jgi:hypothetical protein
MSSIRRSLIAIGLVVLSVSICLAQVEQGAITGVATDQSGASIPRAKVTATNEATHAVAATETNDEGYYKIPYLLPGNYTVVAEKAGFAPQRVNNVPVLVGQIATIDFTFKPGTVHDEVTVTANSVLVEQATSSLGYVIGTTQILELPANRNAYSLVTLSPGVIAAGNTATGPIVNGGRSNTTAVLFDGQETRNNSTLDNDYTPPMEAVAEVRFITNSFSAEYGRSQGGVLTAAGKTGTNELRGSVYEYFRNDKLNANGWNNNRNRLRLNPLRHNEYGFSLGGPVYLPRAYDGRSRTFFFFNWEQMRDHSPNNFTGNVPTAEQRAGDFSKTVTSSGALIRIYDPATTRPDPNSPGNYIRDPFPNNQIPATRIEPRTQKILSYYPAPTLPGVINNYAAPVTRTDSWNKYFTRVDHNFGDKNRLFFRYGRQGQPISNPFVNAAFPGEGTNGENGNMRTSSWTMVLSDTQAFTPSLIGEFRLGTTRWKRVQSPRSLGFDITTIGLPQYLKAVTGDALFPLIDVTDMTSLGPARASHNVDAENTPEPQAHFTWVKGAHAVKTGLDVLFCQFNTFRPDYPSGNFSFSRGYTQGPNPALGTATGGYGVATLLLGAPSGGSFTVGPSLALLQKSYNWYLQDDWKIARALTLNLGIRWEYQTPWTERYNHLAYFDPGVADPLTGYKGLLSFTTSSHRYPSIPQKGNWAPRVGLAWTFAKGTVFRAGYGWFYAPGSGGIGSSPGDLGSGSQTSTAVYTGPTQAAPNTPPPGATLTNPFVTGLLPFPSTLQGGGISAILPNWLTPKNQMWNANIQRTITGNLLVEAAYIGSRGQHIWSNINIDAASSQYLPLGSQLLALVPNPFYGKITSGSLSSATVRYNQLLLPYPHYTSINWLRGSVGDSVYHGFTLRAERRFAKGLLFQSSYTAAKLIDNVVERFIGGAGLIDPNNLRRSRSISASDISQRWVSNFVYELPVGHGKRWVSQGVIGRILGNWQTTGIFTMQTGTPIAISPACATQLPGVSCYANRLRDGNLPASQQNMDRWFDTTAYASPAQYSMGNGSRTEPNLRNPGTISFDSVLSRWQPIRERMKLQFRAEMYNILNHPNPGGPSASITSSTFGQITTKSGSRTITLALRLAF